MSESGSPSYPKFDTEEHRHKPFEGSSLQLRHNATITSFPFDPPFDFQSRNPSPKADLDDDETEQVSPSIYSDRGSLRIDSHYKSEYGYQHSSQDEYQLQPQCFSPTSFTTNDHNLHECPFYASEVSNLKLQVIELEYINATLGNKVRKYRNEIRLFKKDIKGYKLDRRQFAELLMEKENEIETLHRKITQLLDQDCVPSPPKLTPSPMNGGNHKRYGHITDLSVKRRDFARNEGDQRSFDHGAGQIGRVDTGNNPKWWM
ncbi:hypothetical protein DPV78_002088 [Talaromyces pinophilus]|nr:hypothetical protein DPV78_002088 [Talaromyces pinophilus]